MTTKKNKKTDSSHYSFELTSELKAKGKWELDDQIFILPQEWMPLNFKKLIEKVIPQVGMKELYTADEIIAQYEAKVLSLKKNSQSKVQFLKLYFNTGKVSCFLFLNEKISPFELQTELRENLGSFLSEVLSDSKKTQMGLNLESYSQKSDSKDVQRVLQSFVFLMHTLLWKPVDFGRRVQKSSKEKNHFRVRVQASFLSRENFRSWVQLSTLQALANNEVRTLAELPANELTPRAYREHVRKYAQKEGLQFEFWNIAELKKRKAGAFLAVARADQNSEGGIIHLKYSPRSSKKPVLALVGKGICFDTGGYNIKTGSYMLGMHGDMTGSALALALCGLLSRLKVDFEVHAYLAIAENLISPTAYKPNEVVIASDGTSIEVVDTDAEGRMILADTLVQVRKQKPSLAIDFATLTGAAIRALDTRRSAVFSNRTELLEASVQAGERSGERTWPFPIGEDYRKELDSKIADIMQCASGNNSDHIYAATFLSHFIGEEIPWIHVDLSSTKNKGGLGLISSQTTGFGVLWAMEFIQYWMNNKI